MSSKDKDFHVILISFTLAMIISWSFYFRDARQADNVDIKDFPKVIDGWVSEDIPISKNDLEILETNNAFVRRYWDPAGGEVYLYIIYSQSNRKISHPPEICYTGSGASILENVHDPISVNYKNLTIDTNRMLLQDKGSQQVVFYWFKAGDALVANYWEQQILTVFDIFWGKRTGSALIRISADVKDQDKQGAIKEIKAFTDLIAPLLFKYLP